MKGKTKISLKNRDKKKLIEVEETIKLLIKTLESGKDTKRCYHAIYQILFEQQVPALIMKYLSYVDIFPEKLTLIKLLSDADKVKYFELCEIYDYEMIISSFEDDELKIKYLPRLLDEYEMYNIVLSLKTDENKIRCLDFFELETLKANIVDSFRDRHKILDVLLTFSSLYQKHIIDQILSEELKKEYFYQCNNYVQLHLICGLKDDYFKSQHLELFKLCDRIAILLTFTDESLLLSILNQQPYSQHINEFLDMITDQNFIEKYFDNCDDLMQKLQIINKITNPTTQKRLITKLDNPFFQTALASNCPKHKAELVAKQNVDDIKFDLDEQITFGVELEACIDKYDKASVLLLKKILSNWKIVSDASLKNGIEVVSPVLTFCQKDLQTLKFICEFFSRNGFYSDTNCGGHIHFGFDYFTTIDEFNIFLNLYGNVEDILYLISNRRGSEIRPNIQTYAGKLKPQLDKIANSKIDWQHCYDLAKYALIIKSEIKDRYFGLNLLNMNEEFKNTLEFRMPNGEINFQEIVLNIRLFAKLIESAKKINELLIGNVTSQADIKKLALYQKLISVELDEREKVSYFLNILFDELIERNLYYKRYVNNSWLNQNQEKNTKKVLCLKKNN